MKILNKICIFIILIHIGSLALYAQNLSEIFREGNYSANARKDMKRKLNGDISQFTFGTTKYTNISTSVNTENFFVDVEFGDVISSNTIRADMTMADGIFTIYGAEIYLKKPHPISSVGFSLHSTNDDVRSKYFLIAFLTKTNTTRQVTIPSSRMIVYFDENMNVQAELISVDGIYYIQGTYQYLSQISATIEPSKKPSFFIMERGDQSVVSLINVYGRSVQWAFDDISLSDKTALSFSTGVLNMMRFEIGYSNTLLQEKKFIQETGPMLIENDFFILPENILLPEEIQ